YKHIYFSEGMLLLAFLSLVALGVLLFYYKKQRWKWFFVPLLALELFYGWEFYSKNSKAVFYVFHKTATSVFAWQNGHHLQLCTAAELPWEELKFLDGFMDQNDFTGVAYCKDSIQDFYTLG